MLITHCKNELLGTYWYSAPIILQRVSDLGGWMYRTTQCPSRTKLGEETFTGFQWFALVWMNTRCKTMESNPVRTHSNSLGAHPAVRTQWQCTPWKRLVRTGSRCLKQSFGCGGKNLCCTLFVYYVAAELCCKYGMQLSRCWNFLGY